MKRQKNKYVVCLLVAIILCFIVVFYNKENRKIESNEEVLSSGIELDEENVLSEIEPLKETSGGFYLYDKEKQPIMNDQSIVIGIEDSLEFNIECVNTCEVELNYSLVILVNDCYQEVNYEGGSGLFQGKGKLQKGSSEIINTKFKISSNNQAENNELRIIMFYYPDEVPKDDLDQVLVGESIGVYPIEGSITSDVKFDNNLNNMKLHAVSAEQGVQAVWLTEKECSEIPKFDYILESQKPIYFNSIGGQKSYMGMIFVDGVPIKINKNYVFGWNQLEKCLLNYKIASELVDGNTIFAYMYEKGAGMEETFVTNLYKINDE